jgi:hypothetical protein
MPVDECWECGEEPCICEELQAEAEQPTQWESYSTEFDTTRYLEWVDYANEHGFAAQQWLKRWYSSSDLLHEISIRTSPMLTRMKAECFETLVLPRVLP